MAVIVEIEESSVISNTIISSRVASKDDLWHAFKKKHNLCYIIVCDQKIYNNETTKKYSKLKKTEKT